MPDLITINKVSFCDEITPGRFEKVNITGLIPSRRIAFEVFPYKFVSKMIVMGTLHAKPQDTYLSIQFFDINDQQFGESTFSMTETIEEKNINRNFPLELFFIIPINFDIGTPGKMRIKIYHDSNEIYLEEYTLEQGSSPNIRIGGHIPHSGIFTGDQPADEDFVVNLLATPTKSLKIFDSHVDAVSLAMLLSKTDPNLMIQVVTYPQYKKVFDTDTTLNSRFKNIEVRFSKGLHDRFIIINDSEYYQFGHSLKDVVNKKLSRFSKITSAEELVRIDTLLGDVWSHATS